MLWDSICMEEQSRHVTGIWCHFIRGSFILIIAADEILLLQNLTPVIYQVLLKFRYLDIITYRTTTSQSVDCHSWGDKILNLKACLISVFLQTSLLVIFNQSPVAYSSHLHHVASSNVSNTWFIVTLIYSSLFHWMASWTTILSISSISQCTVQWISGRIKSEQTTAWNKCWSTVPNTVWSVFSFTQYIHYQFIIHSIISAQNWHNLDPSKKSMKY